MGRRWDRRHSHAGHNYVGHDSARRGCIGNNCTGHTCICRRCWDRRSATPAAACGPRRRPLPKRSGASLWRTCRVFGHNYIGHNHIGHSYLGHNYIGHNYIGHNYIGRNYIGHNAILHLLQLPGYVAPQFCNIWRHGPQNCASENLSARNISYGQSLTV